MNKMFSLLSMASALVIGTAALPNSASASTAIVGFPCTVGYFPGTAYYGAGGGGYATLYSQPLCQGTYVGSGQFFSEGANATCSSDTLAATRHPATMFSALYEKLVDASDRGQNVQFTINTCGQIGYVFFNGY